ncbi:uroporphyrinogen decarboxylase family protein [Blautia sp. HCP3S3_H10_2]
MNGYQRIQAVLEGKEVDVTPIGGWQHNSLIDRDPEKMIAGTIRFTEENNWDLVKIMSQPQYMGEACGDVIEFPENDPARLCGITKKFAFSSPEALAALEPLTLENPVFARELRAADGIVKHYKKEKVVIPTFFTPLSWLKLCTSPIERVEGLDYSSYQVPTVSDYIEKYPNELMHGLEVIHENNLRLAKGMIEAGVDGFFYSTQYTTRELISEADFQRFEKPFLMDFLEKVKGYTWFNVLHVHGIKNLMFDQIYQCEAQAFNWEDHVPGVSDEERTSISEVRSHTDKVIMAGIERVSDFTFSSSLEEIEKRFKERYQNACAEVGGKNFIFTPGCALTQNLLHRGFIHGIKYQHKFFPAKTGDNAMTFHMFQKNLGKAL